MFYHQRLREAAHAAIADDAPPRAARAVRRAGSSATGGDPGQLAYHCAARRRARARRALGDRRRRAARAQLAWGLAADWYARALALGASAPAARAQLARVPVPRRQARRRGRRVLDARARRGRPAMRSLARARRRGVPQARRARARRSRSSTACSRAAASRATRNRARSVAARGRASPRAGSRRSRRRPQPVDDVLAAAYRVIASFLSTPYPIESLEYVLRGVALAERTGDRAAHAHGHGDARRRTSRRLARPVRRSRDRERAAARRRRAARRTRAWSRPAPTGMLATLRGDWAGMRAAHAEAERDLPAARPRALVGGLVPAHATGRSASYYAGEPARALELLDELDRHQPTICSRARCSARAAAARSSLDRRPRARARARPRCSSAPRPRIRAWPRSIARCSCGELALAEHDWARARARSAHELARSARAQWLSAMPAISAMVDVIAATAEIGLGDRAAAPRAPARSRARAVPPRPRVVLRGDRAAAVGRRPSTCSATTRPSRRVLARAAAVADERGGQVDRLAIAALDRRPRSRPGSSGPAVAWSTGSMIEEEPAWQRR